MIQPGAAGVILIGGAVSLLIWSVVPVAVALIVVGVASLWDAFTR